MAVNFTPMFISAIIFCLIGFFTEKVFGLNIEKFASDIIACFFLITMLSFVTFSPQSINDSADNIAKMINFFVSALPGIVIGDVAGSLVAEITEAFE